MSFDALWRELEVAAASSSGRLIRRRIASQSGLDLFVAVERPAATRSFLWFLPPSVLSELSIPEPSRGIQIDVASDVDQERSWLRMALTDRAFTGVFTALVTDLVDSATVPPPELTAEAALLQRLEHWRQLLQRIPGEVLGREAQRGLFGELWVLRKHLFRAVSPDSAVQSWTGPERAPQDFQFPTVAIEVKTSASSAPDHLTISGERQLDPSHLTNLFLIHLILDDRRAGGNETLPGIVDDIRERLTRLQVPRFTFEERLRMSGFREDHRREYLERSYSVLGENIFRVTGAFPRLTAGDLPDGITNLVYDVSLSSCLPFRALENDLLAAIEGI